MDELHDKSVLVVDDDPGMLRAMSKVLAGEVCKSRACLIQLQW